MKILQRLGLKPKKRSTADLAKERLQIIVSHESHRKDSPDFIKQLQAEIIEVISKYIHVDQDKIKVQLEHHGDQSVLELNVSLPDSSGYEGLDISVQTQEIKQPDNDDTETESKKAAEVEEKKAQPAKQTSSEAEAATE